LGTSRVAVHLVGRLRPEVTITINREDVPDEAAPAEPEEAEVQPEG
jgi:hypothetical protein